MAITLLQNADFARRAEGVCWLSVCIQIGHSRAPRWAPALLRRGARRSRPGFGRLAYSGRLHAGLATPHGTSTRTRSADGRWVWNPVSSPVNRYHVLFKAIENLRTPASPEEHLALAVTGTKTDTLVRGSCHQPCLSQLLIPSLPHRRQKRRQAEACPVGSATARNAAVRRASGAPTLREFLTALRWNNKKADAMTATITQKKMMAPTTPTPISFNGGDRHRMPRRCLHAPWHGGQIVATGILCSRVTARIWHGAHLAARSCQLAGGVEDSHGHSQAGPAPALNLEPGTSRRGHRRSS